MNVALGGWMNFTKRGISAALAALICLTAAGFLIAYIARESSSVSHLSPASGPVNPRADQNPVPTVDEGPYNTARILYSEATTPREQAFATEGLRVAAEEVTEAFDLAENAPQLKLSGRQIPLEEEIDELQKRVQADKVQVSRLEQQQSNSDSDADAIAQQIESVNAQLVLDEGQLQHDEFLLYPEDDPKRKLDRNLQQFQALEKILPQKPPETLETAANLGSFRGQIAAWSFLGNLDELLKQAVDDSTNALNKVSSERTALEKQKAAQESSHHASGAGTPKPGEVAVLTAQAKQQKSLAEFDERVLDLRKLVTVYKNWDSLVLLRRNSVLRLLGVTFALIVLILLATQAAAIFGRNLFSTFKDEQAWLGNLRTPVYISAQVIGLLMALVIILGPPGQISTMLGLLGAGIGFVMRDFIVAFCGWFVLMGKNGIRKHDWVEIEDVTGEVINIGVLRTILLEAGNWTDTGHLTGRKVAFLNSFAVEGHYFNFTTSGQWLWDELHVSVPSAEKVYELMDDIRREVVELTKPDAQAAEQDWKRATRSFAEGEFPAASAVYLRPGSSGLEIVVRYMTKAPQRYDKRAQVTELILGAMYRKRVPLDETTISAEKPLPTGVASA